VMGQLGALAALIAAQHEDAVRTDGHARDGVEVGVDLGPRFTSVAYLLHSSHGRDRLP
jgi:hypothetical protein